MSLLVYQHSAVGRDILVEVLERLGGTVIAAGRSETFVPIDTENIDHGLLRSIQSLAKKVAAEHGPIDAVVSTDGDSDRPLVLYAHPATGEVSFFGGDLLGMIVAEYLKADAVVVPISCNDAIDRGNLKDIVQPKTRIGSPYVIDGMEAARNMGACVVCGWEANGGFLLGSDVERCGRVLKALPTRDALLPILCVLFAAREKSLTLSGLFGQLPARFSRATLLERVPRALGLRIIERLSASHGKILEVLFGERQIAVFDEHRDSVAATEPLIGEMEAIRAGLERYFAPPLGFGRVVRLDYTDGVRILFGSGEVVHIRPSGNADELRIYAVADTAARAEEIAEMGVAEPDGILRRMVTDCLRGT